MNLVGGGRITVKTKKKKKKTSRLSSFSLHSCLHRVEVGADRVDQLTPLLIVGHRQSTLHDVVGVLVKNKFSYPPLLRQLLHKFGLRRAKYSGTVSISNMEWGEG